MATGKDIVKLAKKHVGEKYANVCVPKNNPQWKGPWDCAEFASWCVYQVGGFLYGCVDDNGDPATVESYTGAWEHDAKTVGKMIGVDQAAAIEGAVLLRYPPSPGAMGHIVFADGQGGTVEAHSKNRGVIAGELAGRRWDTGVLVPGISYGPTPPPLAVATPKTVIYRVLNPAMKDATVKKIQQSLKQLGFNPGPIDGEYGPLTHAAVAALQQTKGLIADGEVGPRTAKLLGITLPVA